MGAPPHAATTAAITAAITAAVHEASERVLQEVRRTHVWSFSRASERDELASIGHVLGGEELEQLHIDA